MTGAVDARKVCCCCSRTGLPSSIGPSPMALTGLAQAAVGSAASLRKPWIGMPVTLKRVRARSRENRKWQRRTAPAIATTVSAGS